MASPAAAAGSYYPPPVYGLAPEGITNIILWAVFSIFLSGVAVILRFWSRSIKRTPYSWNDWAAVIAWVNSVALGACSASAVLNDGLGLHIWQLPYPTTQIPNNLKMLLAYNILWAGANTFVRLSILDLYIQIFRTRNFRIVAQVFVAVTVAFYVGIILCTFLYCIPLEANWNPTLPGAKCGNLHAEGIAAGTINLAIDFAVISLPMRALWGLQLPSRKKIALVFIFGIGIFICALSIVRVVALAALTSASDLTFEMNRIGWWSTLENSLGVINCCLPVLQPVIHKIFGSTGLTRVRSSHNKNASYEPSGYGQRSIQVTTEHKVIHSNDGSDDGIPLQSKYQRDVKYMAEGGKLQEFW